MGSPINQLFSEFNRVSGVPCDITPGDSKSHAAIVNNMMIQPMKIPEAIRRLRLLDDQSGLNAAMITVSSVEAKTKNMHAVSDDWIGYFGNPSFIVKIVKEGKRGAVTLEKPIWFTSPPTDESVILKLMRDAIEAWKNFQSKD